jgi:hypothetical protein
MKAIENYIKVQEKDHELFSAMTFEDEVRIIMDKY